MMGCYGFSQNTSVSTSTFTASSLVAGQNIRSQIILDPQSGMSATSTSYVVYRGSNVSDAIPCKLGLWCHGSGENGFNISSVTNAAALPALIYTAPSNWSNWIWVIPQQPSLTTVESSPSYDSVNFYRYSPFRQALDSTKLDCNYDPTQIHLGGFSGGGNNVWALAIKAPTEFASLTNAEANVEGRRCALDNNYTNTSVRTYIVNTVTSTKMWVQENANDGNVTPQQWPRPLMEQFGDTNFTTPWTTNPPYVNGEYSFDSGMMHYSERTTGGYAPNDGGGGGHECVGIFSDTSWKIWVEAQHR